MLMIACLLPLIVFTFLSVIFGDEFMAKSLESGWSDKSVVFEIPAINADPVVGMLALLCAIAIFTVLVGIQIFASGISETSIKALSTGLLYTGLWVVLSLLSAPLINSIEIFGNIIYICLTIGYVIGVIEKMYR